MCDFNHILLTVHSIATAELGTRLLAYHDEIGLAPAQIDRILELVKAWRKRYVKFAEEIVTVGRDIDRQLLEWPVDTDRVRSLAFQRLELIKALESEFISVWANLRLTLTNEQHKKLQSIYRREFVKLPHPILGTDTYDFAPQPLNEASLRT